MTQSITDLDGIIAATGIGFRKHMEDYPTEIIAIPIARPGQVKATYKSHELVAVCPLTGLPDIYYCEIEIHPDKTVPELKTLKFYLSSFRNVGVLHEDLVAQIGEAINVKCSPHYLRVFLDTNIRGGISTNTAWKIGTPQH